MRSHFQEVARKAFAPLKLVVRCIETVRLVTGRTLEVEPAICQRHARPQCAVARHTACSRVATLACMNDTTSKSPGNAGSRGSTGQANSGAQAGNSTNAQGNARAAQGNTNLRNTDARGGGGPASNSSRAKDPAPNRGNGKAG